MDIRVLGPFGVFEDGRRLKISVTKKHGLYVAALAMTEQLSAPQTYVAQRLWPDALPDKPGDRLRQYRTELRRIAPQLVPGHSERLRCRLDVPHDAVDYLRFRSLVRRANGHRAARQSKLLRLALDEWRGEPIEDVAGPGFDPDRKRLTDEWHDVWIRYLNALLEAENAETALHEIREPMRRWVTDEHLLKIQINALHATTGMREVTKAIEEWTSAGRAVSDELLEHVTGLRTQNTRKYRQAPPSIPQQLPAHRPNVIGRTDQTTELDRLLLAPPSSQARIAIIDGMPGSGKSALASQWAFKAVAHFPDGILFAELNGYATTDPVPPYQTLAHFLNQLDIEPPDPTYDGMVTAYRSAIASRKLLVVLDNARDAEQVRPLLPGPGACSTLITSRDRMDSLFVREGVGNVHIGPLARVDSLTLLADTGGPQLSHGAPYADDIAELCGDLPLALVVVGALIRKRIIGDLWTTYHALRDDADRLGNLRIHGGDDVSIETVFQTSHRMLSAEAKRLIWHLAEHPGPTISRTAARALTGWQADQIRYPALEELHAANLVERTPDDRYSLHDLIRGFAARQAEAQPSGARRQATARALDFLLHNAWSCDQVLVPGRALPIGGVSEFPLVAPSDVTEAMDWFTAEYPTLLKAVERAADLHMDRHTWLLAMAMVTYQWRAYRYTDAVETLKRAADAAESVASPTERAMVHRMLGGTYRGLGQAPRAESHAMAAVRVSEDSGDPQAVAYSENALAILYCENGRLDDAAAYFGRAAERLRELGDELNEAVALNGLGCISMNRGDHETALDYCDSAVRLFARTTDVNGHADALANRGRIRMARGQHEHAESDLSAALASYQRLSYPRNEARTLLDLADALVVLRRTGDARTMLLRAQSLFRSLDAPADEVAERIRTLA